MYCPNCGHGSNGNFCVNCGCRLNTPGRPPQQQSPIFSQNKKTNKKAGCLLGVFIILVIGFLASNFLIYPSFFETSASFPTNVNLMSVFSGSIGLTMTGVIESNLPFDSSPVVVVKLYDSSGKLVGKGSKAVDVKSKSYAAFSIYVSCSGIPYNQETKVRGFL